MAFVTAVLLIQMSDGPLKQEVFLNLQESGFSTD